MTKAQRPKKVEKMAEEAVIDTNLKAAGEVTKKAVKEIEKQNFKDRSKKKKVSPKQTANGYEPTKEEIEQAQIDTINNGRKFAAWVGTLSYEQIGMFVEFILMTKDPLGKTVFDRYNKYIATYDVPDRDEADGPQVLMDGITVIVDDDEDDEVEAA